MFVTVIHISYNRHDWVSITSFLTPRPGWH